MDPKRLLGKKQRFSNKHILHYPEIKIILISHKSSDPVSAPWANRSVKHETSTRGGGDQDQGNGTIIINIVGLHGVIIIRLMVQKSGQAVEGKVVYPIIYKVSKTFQVVIAGFLHSTDSIQHTIRRLLLSGNPWKLPYICCLFDPPKMGHHWSIFL